jgi:hypothetical protein
MAPSFAERADPALLQLLHHFDSVPGAEAVLRRAAQGYAGGLGTSESDVPGLPAVDGRFFFEQKYKRVDGNEVASVEALRGWLVDDQPGAEEEPAAAAAAAAGAAGGAAAAAVAEGGAAATVEDVVERLRQALIPSSVQVADGPLMTLQPPTAYMAQGIPVPRAMVDHYNWIHAHETQLTGFKVPAGLWFSLHQKLAAGIFDAGAWFTLEQAEVAAGGGVEESGEEEPDVAVRTRVLLLEGVPPLRRASDIFIVDHAWTFSLADGGASALSTLASSAALRDRVRAVARLAPLDDGDAGDGGDEPGAAATAAAAAGGGGEAEADARELLQHAPRFSSSYVLGGHVLHYMLDEFGAAFRHSSESPSFAFAPFYHGPAEAAYTLVWPLREVRGGEEATRDWGPAATAAWRAASCPQLLWSADADSVDSSSSST